MPGPLNRASVPDLVFAELREAIVSGRYQPGERLPPQRALASELEVNMASVREALKRLEQLRLVVVRHGDATRVLDWRASGGLEALSGRGDAGSEMTAALFEARRLLLVEAARLAALRRSDQQARELERLAREVGAADSDAAALVADWAYMAALVQAAGNLVFELIMNSVRELYLPSAARFAPMLAAPEQLAPLYREIAGAIRERDGDGAASLIAELARAQEQRMLDAR